ncbi:MAG: ribosome small subunit-dependent GTPase A [Candidatus Doudnabacteria bacterium]|nr:ribosome small subunit-dependent GTPase A [Candidatus Doudnabacteria bacterium]
MQNINTQELIAMGYNEFFEEGRKAMGLERFLVARVISEYRGGYKVKTGDEEFLAKITGKQIYNASSREDYPAVGDWVVIEKLNQDQAVVRGILPRKTILKRKSAGKDEVQVIASNIDIVFVVESVNSDYNINRLERYVALARDGQIEPAVVLNKADLVTPEELIVKVSEIQNRMPGVHVICTSILKESGLQELETYITPRKTYCFLGSSGVGKSSLVKKLVGDESIKTKSINENTDKGKHTTTSREMYVLENGGILIDNPGIREVGLVDSEQGVSGSFEDVVVLEKNCKYTDCSHVHEPDCAVRAAVASGELSKDKYNNYLNLKKEAGFYKMNTVQKRQKDKRFGKFFKKKMDELKEYGHKDY